MERINDFTHYTTEMRKSLIDKIFFMDKMDNEVKSIVDYGCADGVLIDFLSNIFPEINFIGFDISDEMIRAAEKRCEGKENTVFLTDFDFFTCDCSKSSVNLSSLIHEVYSYGTKESINSFWNVINNAGFRYITVRDMCLDQSAHRPALKEDILKVRRFCNAGQIEQFESYHGSLADNYNLIHFLMKYRYQSNWERECKENYLPLTMEQFIRQFANNYELTYFDHYTLPFLAQKVKQDMDITIKDYTHVKMILKRKDI